MYWALRAALPPLNGNPLIHTDYWLQPQSSSDRCTLEHCSHCNFIDPSFHSTKDHRTGARGCRIQAISTRQTGSFQSDVLWFSSLLFSSKIQISFLSHCKSELKINKWINKCVEDTGCEKHVDPSSKEMISWRCVRTAGGHQRKLAQSLSLFSWVSLHRAWKPGPFVMNPAAGHRAGEDAPPAETAEAQRLRPPAAWPPGPAAYSGGTDCGVAVMRSGTCTLWSAWTCTRTPIKAGGPFAVGAVRWSVDQARLLKCWLQVSYK